MQIVKQKIRAFIIGDENVRITVSIKVSDGHTHSFAEVLGDSGFLGNIGERAVPVVAVERVRDRLVPLGIAVFALLARHANGIVIHIPFHVVGNEQIRQAVVVVIHPYCRDRPHLLALPHTAANAGFGGNVGESSVAIIVIKDVLPVARNEEIGVAVIVVVADRDAHAVVARASAGKARGFRHVRETAVFVLAIEAIPVAWVGTIKFLWKPHRAGHAPAIYQKNVEQAIVIVVEQGHAARHRFNEVFL